MRATPEMVEAGANEYLRKVPNLSIYGKVEMVLNAALALLPRQQPAIPDGFVLVPREPTEEAIKEGTRSLAYYDRPHAANMCRRIYHAMISVSPQPPAQPADPESERLADWIVKKLQETDVPGTIGMNPENWEHVEWALRECAKKPYSKPPAPDERDAEIVRLHKENEALDKKYRALMAWYDKQVGTPCEEIRHMQEVEELRARLTKATDALDAMIERARQLMEQQAYGRAHIGRDLAAARAVRDELKGGK